MHTCKTILFVEIMIGSSPTIAHIIAMCSYRDSCKEKNLVQFK